MEVPMDWHDSEADAKIALAVIRRPAQVPITSPNYGGAIITNPGGPGGSGVQQQLSMGKWIQKIVDAEADPKEAGPHDLYFDIISLDPRGVNHTTPTISCFPDTASRQRWNLQIEAEGILGSSATSLRSNWRRARAMADGCSRRLMSTKYNKLAEHVNTTPVVRDIVELIERHGQWREKEAARLVGNQRHNESTSVRLQRTAWRKGEEPLQYWGFSYGTLIGTTFASMYPSRVARMVVDGVIDAHDYYAGRWKANLDDTDGILDRIFEYCSAAGPERCAFYRAGGPSAIRQAYDALLEAIHSDPLSVPGTDEHGPEVITWTDIKLVEKDALYATLKVAPMFTELLQDLTQGNGSEFATYKRANHAALCRQVPLQPSSPDNSNGTEPSCDPVQNPFSHACVLPGWSPYDASAAVLCTDGDPQAMNFSEDEFAVYWRELKNQSRAMGDFWAQTRLACAGWGAGSLQAKWRFSGPFGADSKSLRHPPLFIGNHYDPVTPLRNAIRMASLFEGSRALEVEAEGHCTFSSESKCAADTVKQYFQRGELPEIGAVCSVDRKPFLGRVDDEDPTGSHDLSQVSQAWTEMMLAESRSLL